MEGKAEEVIEQVVKLTLTDATLGAVDLALSPSFCSHLLEPDHLIDHAHDTASDFTQGVPAYPLYKSLASALCKSISCGAFCGPEKTTLIDTEESLYHKQQEEEEWSKLIKEKGFDLVQVLKMLNFDLHVQEPFFSQLKDGLKTVEGRCAVGDYKRISPGALILFNKCLVLQVQDVQKYASFSEMLEAESIEKVLPGVKTIKEGVQIYRNFYPEEMERLNGVLSIRVTKPTFQLSDAMASIIRGLSYKGVQQLLGIVHTEGTSLMALPPPRSSILSSFLSPHNANVKSSTLTVGARSLAKHVHRSSLRFWGNFCDSAKNLLALDVIRKLLANCCWLNLHIVPPHGVVFEIRVADGYGARWSEDGTKFIGFLEPYMENGHSKGWKH
ncbi:uncharacterized protein LOC108200036 isoform X3 [Daucus carota subsp. sativus]|uniref:uncharacterized protein LOC108200036 isoform X3 n=1 Tax=Daucus carota subsp. sativus TaxID=79200 RepID=UPI0030830D00